MRSIKLLKLCRITRQLSQGQVGTATHLRQTEISAYETGRLIPTDAELCRLADLFGVEPEELLRDVDSADVTVPR